MSPAPFQGRWRAAVEVGAADVRRAPDGSSSRNGNSPPKTRQATARRECSTPPGFPDSSSQTSLKKHPMTRPCHNTTSHFRTTGNDITKRSSGHPVGLPFRPLPSRHARRRSHPKGDRAQTTKSPIPRNSGNNVFRPPSPTRLKGRKKGKNRGDDFSPQPPPFASKGEG